MKTRPTRITPLPNQSSFMASATATGMEAFQPRKARLTVLKLSVILCSTFATTAAFGQSSYVWTNQTPGLLTAGDLNQGTNWTVNGVLGINFDAGGVPRPDFQDGVT